MTESLIGTSFDGSHSSGHWWKTPRLQAETVAAGPCPSAWPNWACPAELAGQLQRRDSRDVDGVIVADLRDVFQAHVAARDNPVVLLEHESVNETDVDQIGIARSVANQPSSKRQRRADRGSTILS
jgi:hypothetical protein